MFPDGFIDGRKKTDNRMLSGPVIQEMRQCSCNDNKKDTDYGIASYMFHGSSPLDSICSYLWEIHDLSLFTMIRTAASSRKRRKGGEAGHWKEVYIAIQILHMVCLVDNSNERGDNIFIGNRKSKGGTGDYDL